MVGGDQPHVRSVRRAERQHLAAREPRLVEDARIVGVGHRHAVGAQRVKELAFGMRHAVERAGALEMDRADVGDHRDVGIGPLREPRDLAEMVHAALDRREAMLGAQPEEGERYAHFVIEVALGLQGRSGRRQHFGNQFFRRGLSCRSGDADHAQIGQPRAPRRRQGSERAPGIGRGQHRDAPRRFRKRVRRQQHAGRAALHGLIDEIAAVVLFPAQRDEEPAGDRRARIGEDSLERPAFGVHPRARRPRRLLQRKARAHRLISCSARRASARSSNGRFSVPTIW